MSFQYSSPEPGQAYEWWDAGLRMSDRALGKFHRTCIKYRALIASSFVLTGGHTKVGLMEVFYRLRLPEGVRKEFEKEWGEGLLTPAQTAFEALEQGGMIG